MLPPQLDRLQRAGLLLTAVLFSSGYASVGLAWLLVTVIIEAVILRRLPWQRGPMDVPFLAFLAVFLVSGWVSPYPGIATGSIGLGALTIYLAFGVLHRLLRRDPAFLRPFLQAWVGGGVLAGVWAILLHRMSGTPAFTAALGQNAVGTTLLIALILTTGLYAGSTSTWRYALMAGGSILAVGVMVTYTRGAWLGAMTGLAALFLLTELRQRWRALALVGVLGVVTVVAAGAERAALTERARTISSLEANASRVYLLRASVQMVADHPVLGTGLNTFAAIYPRYRRPDDPNPGAPFAHNIFLNMAVEGGIAGALAFGAVIVAAVMAGWRWYVSSRAQARPGMLLSATLLAAFIGAMTHQQVDGTLLSVHLGAGLWLLVASLAAHAPRP
jgi:O-antigen ligase